MQTRTQRATKAHTDHPLPNQIVLRQLDAVHEGVLHAIRRGDLLMGELHEPVEKMNQELARLAASGIGLGKGHDQP